MTNYDKMRKITATIPYMSSNEYISIDALTKGDNVLRKIGYVCEQLGSKNVHSVRYNTYCFRALLNIRRTKGQKIDAAGLILYHDEDIKTLEWILKLRKDGKSIAEITRIVSEHTGVFFTENNPAGLSTPNEIPVNLGFASKSAVDELARELNEQKEIILSLQTELERLREQRNTFFQKFEFVLKKLSFRFKKLKP